MHAIFNSLRDFWLLPRRCIYCAALALRVSAWRRTAAARNVYGEINMASAKTKPVHAACLRVLIDSITARTEQIRWRNRTVVCAFANEIICRLCAILSPLSSFPQPLLLRVPRKSKEIIVRRAQTTLRSQPVRPAATGRHHCKYNVQPEKRKRVSVLRCSA